MVGKGFAENDIIEHLYDPDATFVSLVGQEREYLLVFLEGFLIDLKCKGIVFQFDERCKRVTVPQVEGVHLVLYQHIEIFRPLLFVVEPREVLWRIGIFIDLMSG